MAYETLAVSFGEAFIKKHTHIAFVLLRIYDLDWDSYSWLGIEPIWNLSDGSYHIVFARVCIICLGGIFGAAIQFSNLWIPKGGVKGYLTSLDLL